MCRVSNVTSVPVPDIEHVAWLTLINLCRVVLPAEDLLLQRAMREYAETLVLSFEIAA